MHDLICYSLEAIHQIHWYALAALHHSDNAKQLQMQLNWLVGIAGAVRKAGAWHRIWLNECLVFDFNGSWIRPPRNNQLIIFYIVVPCWGFTVLSTVQAGGKWQFLPQRSYIGSNSARTLTHAKSCAFWFVLLALIELLPAHKVKQVHTRGLGPK